jgi:organic radical activating enzyme
MFFSAAEETRAKSSPCAWRSRTGATRAILAPQDNEDSTIMDCRILRLLTLKADGNIVCDDSSGYGIVLGEVSTQPGWNIHKVIDAPVYAHVRRAFKEDRAPWPGICESCHTFSKDQAYSVGADTLNTRIRLMIEPTLACNLACPSCQRKREGRTRKGGWDLDPAVLEALVRSCAQAGIVIEEAHYLGWGEPLLYPRLAELTAIVRRWHPRCVQEATTSGSIDFETHLEAVDLDKLTVSCDGVRQDSYVQYRRNGSIDKVFSLLENIDRFKIRPFVEWKYILFEHNDSDEDIRKAQDMAKALEIDSLLFIITNSKKKSTRFTPENIDAFPIMYDFVTISPAAGTMMTKRIGEILQAESTLGDREGATLFLDDARVTATDILELRGWALLADGRYADFVDCHVGPRKARIKPRERRQDVATRRPYAAGPDCGFAFRIRIEEGQAYNELNFALAEGDKRHHFTAVLHFN